MKRLTDDARERNLDDGLEDISQTQKRGGKGVCGEMRQEERAGDSPSSRGVFL